MTQLTEHDFADAHLLTDHFSRAELQCPCCRICVMSQSFLDKLEEYRKNVDTPLPINSGYRCEKHNEAVGGEKNSWHKQGRAVDIKWDHMTGSQKYRLLSLAIRYRFYGIGIAKTFLHLDNRDDARGAIWSY